jgi:hypothetical protein
MSEMRLRVEVRVRGYESFSQQTADGDDSHSADGYVAGIWYSVELGPETERALEDAIGQLVRELPTHDQNVDEVERLENDVGLVGLDSENNDARAVASQIRAL